MNNVTGIPCHLLALQHKESLTQWVADSPQFILPPLLPSMKAGVISPLGNYSSLNFPYLCLTSFPPAQPSRDSCDSRSLCPSLPHPPIPIHRSPPDPPPPGNHVSKLHPVEFDYSWLNALLQIALTCSQFSSWKNNLPCFSLCSG